MSRTPHPVALTSAMLMQRAFLLSAHSYTNADPARIASLASDLQRLAKGCSRQAVAECNGEFYDGQREYNDCRRSSAELDDAIAKVGNRLDKRIVKLHLSLAALSIDAHRTGDPRGFTLRLRSTDPTFPLPTNGMEQGEWGIG